MAEKNPAEASWGIEKGWEDGWEEKRVTRVLPTS